MIFVDSHVHIYDCFDVDFFLDSALRNFRRASGQHGTSSGDPAVFVLLLTERKKENWYKKTLQQLESSDHGQVPVAEKWEVFRSGDADFLTATRKDSTEIKIYLVPGQQIYTREKIEVLGLYSQTENFDGLSFEETITILNRNGAVSVLPWGVGKWFGKRGKILHSFINGTRVSGLYLGDNGGRPLLWPTPKLFRLAAGKGIIVLPGSDVLPLPEEAGRVAGFGFCLDNSSSTMDPIAYLKEQLRSYNAEIIPFGGLQTNIRFAVQQLRLRFS
jgi:hypothetical protein